MAIASFCGIDICTGFAESCLLLPPSLFIDLRNYAPSAHLYSHSRVPPRFWLTFILTIFDGATVRLPPPLEVLSEVHRSGVLLSVIWRLGRKSTGKRNRVV